MFNMLREIDRFERELLEPFLHFGFGGRGSFANTKSDVVSDETGYSVYSAIAGIDIKDVDIVYDGGILRIEGNRKGVVEDDSGWTLVQSEIEGGRFKREFRFGEAIDQEGINASYSEGILKVYLPKAKKSEPIKIEAN